MDFTEPTTVIGLAAVAIGAIVYVILQFDKSHKKAMGEFIDMLKNKDENYTSFVNSNNHKMTEQVTASTEALVSVTKAIEESTRSMEHHNEVLKELKEVIKNRYEN